MWKFVFGSKPKPSKKDFDFRAKYTHDQRLKEAAKIMKEHPDKVPVVIEKGSQNNLPELKLKKFLVRKDLTVGQLILKLRTKLSEDLGIDLDSNEALFLFIDNESIPATTQTIDELYQKYASSDSFLYFSYLRKSSKSWFSFMNYF